MEKYDLILLAIDNEQILQLFQRALAVGSFTTAVAHDRVSLDKALQESTPALIIISQHFGMGDELTLSLSLLERFPTLPILLFFNAGFIGRSEESLVHRGQRLSFCASSDRRC